MSVVSIEVVFNRSRGDESTQRSGVEDEQEGPEDGALRYTVG